ncbi:hypothetical protein PG993_012084 [Apiospora rasikravindrae]|uniref:Mitochondrial inner-membrane-bound regulator-domain-containing protein n=1 Tax=Apiospora rasikravindrae TaxID=990691 RepID=A0ABR1S1L1_9PEZI
MISRKISSGAICLGCRLRLLSQATRPRYPHALTRYTAAVASRGQTPRWFTTDQPAARPTERGQNKSFYKSDFFATDDPANDYENRSSRRKPEGGAFTFKRLNISKIHLSRNRLLTEASENLGTDMLGKPAYAIVMKDQGLYRQRKRSAEAIDTGTGTVQEESSQLEIQSLLEHQDEPATPEEVRANIDGLCPESETYLPEKEFRRIQYELTEGFLKSQLVDYIDSFKAALKEATRAEEETKEVSENEHDEAELESQVTEVQDHTGSGEASPQGEVDSSAPVTTYPWIREISPWVRLNSEEVAAGGLPEDTDQHLHGYVSEAASPKEKLAVRIMRECWGLHIEELMGGLGQVEVAVRKLEFTMLTRGTRRFLKLLNDTFLDRGESMEIFRNKATIRFVSTRPKAETLIHELNGILQTITTRHFPVSLVAGPHDLIDEVLLEEVGRITNTYINQSHSTKKIAVTWLESRGRMMRQSQYEVEDLRHVVFRLLLTALNPELALLKLYKPEETTPYLEGSLLVDEYNREKWSWKDRLGRWARYINPPETEDAAQHFSDEQHPLPNPPVQLQLAETPAATPIEEDTALQITRDVLDGAEVYNESTTADLENANIEVQTPSERYPFQPVRWSPEVQTTTSAVFGHVLLDAMGLPAKVLIPEHEQTRTDLSSYSRIFSPIVPHPMQLAALHGGQQPDKQGDEPSFSVEHTILVRFLPSPSPNPARPNYPGPPLELRLALTDSDDPVITGVHSMRAIVETHLHDVMLPSSPVDVRVQQQRVATLQGHPEDLATWQPLQAFLDRARLDISDGKLEMPSQQRFQIPARLFYNAHHPPISTTLSAKAAAKEHAKREKLEKKLEARMPAKKNEPVSILYAFMGLELHRSISVPYEGHTLTYTSIEAGQGGGRRAELALSPTRLPSDISSAETGETLEEQGEQPPTSDFLNLVYKTAQTAKFWSGFSG